VVDVILVGHVNVKHIDGKFEIEGRSNTHTKDHRSVGVMPRLDRKL